MMARKLYTFIDNKCTAESVDGVSMQEVHLGGHTMVQIIKEKLQDFLISMKINTIMKSKQDGTSYHPTNGNKINTLKY